MAINSTSFDVNNTSLQSLAKLFEPSKLPDTVSIGKSYAESCAPSTIQGRASSLNANRIKNAGFFAVVALVFTAVAFVYHYANLPGNLRTFEVGLAGGTAGLMALISIAIFSVSHWKLTKKLFIKELQDLFEEEQKAIDAHSERLNKSEKHIQEERTKNAEHKNLVECLQSRLPKSDEKK